MWWEAATERTDESDVSPVQRRTLPGPDYHDQAVFELDRERIFYRSWFLAGRAEHAANAGDWFTVDVVDESILVVRGEDGQLRAFYNVCRHRGSRLKEEPSGSLQGAIACPYHDWCYSFTSGDLVATPRVGKDEVDRSQNGLRPVHLDEWQGFVYVNLDRETPKPVRETLGAAYDDMIAFERFDIASLRIGATTEWLVEANWKIIIENYNECLHCPNVHPELVQVIPAYKKGWVFEEGREDGGVGLAGTTSYAPPGSTTIAVLPTMTEEESHSVYGGTMFPNAMMDIAGTGVVVTQLFPIDATHTRQVAWYLFHPDAMAAADFDPSGIVEFGELVGGQDNAICERAQRGVKSRSFADGGVYPDKDQYVWEFNQRYLRERDGLAGT
jgi:Rieske 2Fe-2S family protein